MLRQQALPFRTIEVKQSKHHQDQAVTPGSGFIGDSSACRIERFPVGVLPPWWLSGGGAEYLGRRVAGGIDCHVWGKAGFIFYYE